MRRLRLDFGAPRGWRGLVLAVFALLLLSTALRLTGIGREPFWLDEIFSHTFSSGSIRQVLEATAKDIHPPLYYLGLLGWREILGSAEATIRSYSALWSVLGVLAVILLAKEVAGGWSAGLIAGLLAAVNPLDVYYAQEARMYAQAATLGAVTSWLLVRWIKGAREGDSWRAWPLAAGYCIGAILLLYTHYVAAAVLVAQGLLALGWFVARKAWRAAVLYCSTALVAAAAFMPWLVYVKSFRAGLYSAERMSWVPKPTLGDPFRLLAGDLFWGQAGFGGRPVALVLSSVVLVSVAACLVGWLWNRRRDAAPGVAMGDAPAISVVFALWMLLAPVALAIAASSLYKGAFYRPRFCLLVLAPLLTLVALACDRLPLAGVRITSIAVLAGMMTVGTVSQYRTTHKTGLTGFVKLWHEHGPPDQVLFYPRWNRRVAGYFLGAPVWNVPTRPELEQLLREGGPLRLWICTNVGYRLGEASGERAMNDWALTLGPRTREWAVDNMQVVEVSAQPLGRTYPQWAPGKPLEPGTAAADPYLWSGWYEPERTFRWSRGQRSVVVFGLSGQPVSTIELSMFCFKRQRITVTLNGAELASFLCEQRAPHRRSFAIPPGAAAERNTLVLEHPDAVSPAEVGESGDTRKLALGVEWIEIR